VLVAAVARVAGAVAAAVGVADVVASAVEIPPAVVAVPGVNEAEQNANVEPTFSTKVGKTDDAQELHAAPLARYVGQ